MSPADAINWVKTFCEKVGDEAKREEVVGHLILQFGLESLGDLWVFLGIAHLEVAIKHEEATGDHNQNQREKQVLDKQEDQLRRAHSLLPDQQVVLTLAPIAVNPLADYDLGCLAVPVNLPPGAEARFAELGGDFEIFEVGQLLLQIDFHLLVESCEGPLW